MNAGIQWMPTSGQGVHSMPVYKQPEIFISVPIFQSKDTASHVTIVSTDVFFPLNLDFKAASPPRHWVYPKTPPSQGKDKVLWENRSYYLPFHNSWSLWGMGSGMTDQIKVCSFRCLHMVFNTVWFQKQQINFFKAWALPIICVACVRMCVSRNTLSFRSIHIRLLSQ